MMKKLSIKRIKRLIDEEKPRAVAKYMRNFISKEKQSRAEVSLDKYAYELMKKEIIEKSDVLKKLEEIEESTKQ